MCTNRCFLRLVLIINLALLIALVFPARMFAQDKTLTWQEFSVDIRVNQDGTFDVAEHQTINFTSGSFTFGYRDIPVHNLGYIDNWQLTDSSGHVYQQVKSGDVPYTFVVNENNSSYQLSWHFPTITNAIENLYVALYSS